MRNSIECRWNEIPKVVVFTLCVIIPTAGTLCAFYNFISYSDLQVTGSVPGLIFSVIWTIFIFYIVRSLYKDRGSISNMLVYIFDILTIKKSFKLIIDEQKLMIKGYYVLGKYFELERHSFTGTFTVEISKGQASGMAGRDVNDWSMHAYIENNPNNKKLYFHIRDCGKKSKAMIVFNDLIKEMNEIGLHTNVDTNATSALVA